MGLPLIHTMSIDVLLQVIRLTKMRCLVGYPRPLLELAPRLPADTSLRLLVVVPQFSQLHKAASEAEHALAALPSAVPPGVKVASFESIRLAGVPERAERPLRIRLDDELATLSCTSGSTVRILSALKSPAESVGCTAQGEPKLCIMTETRTHHKIANQQASPYRKHIYWCGRASIGLSSKFLTLVRLSRVDSIYDRWNDLRSLLNGGQVHCYSGDLNRMLEDLQLARPSSVSFAPRLWNQLYAEYLKSVRALTFPLTRVDQRLTPVDRSLTLR